ncbi:hypothetical protein OKW28_008016 [Paraburkholderia sp. 40]
MAARRPHMDMSIKLLSPKWPFDKLSRRRAAGQASKAGPQASGRDRPRTCTTAPGTYHNRGDARAGTADLPAHASPP